MTAHLIKLRLLGRFSTTIGERELTDYGGARSLKLFAYLLLHRDRPHRREILAGSLWGHDRAADARKDLRQALWQLQAALVRASPDTSANSMLKVDSEWICLDSTSAWLDVRDLDQAFAHAQRVPVRDWREPDIARIENAVDLYAGDLLEGWYDDWCILERERLAGVYVLLLDKLMVQCEATGAYDRGIAIGARVLRHDPAREQTHRRLMRLYMLNGDRTTALRQYTLCAAALNRELDVTPSPPTIALYQQIRDGRGAGDRSPVQPAPPPGPSPVLADLAGHLRQLRAALATLHQQVQQDLDDVESALTRIG